MTDAPDQSKDSIPEQSEWGRINAGQRYGILCVDVDRALSRADMGKHEQALMQYIREHSWGTATSRKGGKGNAWPEAAPVRWRLQEITEETGIPETRLCEARKSLLDSRMLVESRGHIAINKNADEWIWPAVPAKGGKPEQPTRPRLDDAAMRYAIAGRTRREQESGGESVTPQRNASMELITPERKEITLGRKEITPERKKITAERNSPHKERTRDSDFRDQENTETSSKADDDEFSPPPKADPEPINFHPGNTLADVRRVEAWVKDLPKGVGLQQGLDYKISVWAKDYPIGWIHEALRDAYAHDARRMSPYVHRMLQRWKAEGGPDAARERHEKAKAKPVGAALPTEVYIPPKTPYIPMVPSFKVDALKKKNPGMTDAQAVEAIRAETLERQRVTNEIRSRFSA